MPTEISKGLPCLNARGTVTFPAMYFNAWIRALGNDIATPDHPLSTLALMAHFEFIVTPLFGNLDKRFSFSVTYLGGQNTYGERGNAYK